MALPRPTASGRCEEWTAHHLIRLPVHGLPDATIRAIAKLLDDLVPAYSRLLVASRFCKLAM